VADYREYIGQATGRGTIVVERSPLTNFAKAVLDESPVYRNAAVAREEGFDDVPAPPTFGFSIQNWGRFEELQTADQPATNPMYEVMGKLYANGGMVLHGEQTFTYHRPVVAGQRLDFVGLVKDIYEKASGDRTMTFIVTEDTYRDESGELVLTSTMNLIHRS
jgi:acyl dehydratase